MRLSLFDSFADMIEAIPARAIIRTLEREGPMIEADLACKRPVPPKEAESILSFCRLVHAFKNGAPIPFSATTLPMGHLEFYRKTLARLVDAEELPSYAQAEFDHLVCNAALKAFDYAV